MNYRYFISYRGLIQKSGSTSFFRPRPIEIFSFVIITLGKPIDSREMIATVVDSIREDESKKSKSRKEAIEVALQSISLLKTIEPTDPDHKVL